MKEHRGTLILILGILGLVVCQPIGIAAWVMGNNDLKEMDSGRMDPEGRGLTNGGRICGMIAVAFMVLSVLIFGGMMIVGGGAAIMENSGR